MLKNAHNKLLEKDYCSKYFGRPQPLQIHATNWSMSDIQCIPDAGEHELNTAGMKYLPAAVVVVVVVVAAVVAFSAENQRQIFNWAAWKINSQKFNKEF